MVLEGNKRKSKTGIAAEEELERNVKLVGFEGAGNTGVAATNHFLETVTLLLGHGQLGPDFEPLTVVLVDALATDFKLDVLNHGVTKGIDNIGGGVFLEFDFQPHVGNEITITIDCGGNTVT